MPSGQARPMPLPASMREGGGGGRAPLGTSPAAADARGPARYTPTTFPACASVRRVKAAGSGCPSSAAAEAEAGVCPTRPAAPSTAHKREGPSPTGRERHSNTPPDGVSMKATFPFACTAAVPPAATMVTGACREGRVPRRGRGCPTCTPHAAVSHGRGMGWERDAGWPDATSTRTMVLSCVSTSRSPDTGQTQEAAMPPAGKLA